MSTITSQATVDIYPSSTPNGDYLAVLQNSLPVKTILPPINSLSNELSTDCADLWKKTRLVIMVDQSGSMYSSFTGLICRTLPTFFSELGVPADFVVDLLLFTDHTVYRRMRVDEFPTALWSANGCERLAPCMSVVRDILDSCEYGSLARLITFSDGEIGDLHDQMTASAELYQYIQSTIAPKVLVSSHGFRVMSSTYASPDTRALSSVLQFHTLPGEMPQLLDLSCDQAFMYREEGAQSFPTIDALAVVNGVENPKHPITHGKIIARACTLKTPRFAALSTPNTVNDFFANPAAYIPQNTLSATQLMGMDSQSANARTQETQLHAKYPESHKLMFLDVPYCKLVQPDEAYTGYTGVGYRHPEDQAAFKEENTRLKALKAALIGLEEANPPAVVVPVPVTVTPDSRAALSMFKTAPWCEGSPILTVHVDANRLLFWIDKALFDAYTATHAIDSSLFTISDNTHTKVTINMHEVITSDVYQHIIASRIDYYVMQAKLLKLVDKDVSKNTIVKMATYFNQLEASMQQDLPSTEMTDDSSAELASPIRARIDALKLSMKSAHRQLALQLSQIQNMDAVGSFNNAQAASFLRTTAGSSKASRGLVDRHGAALDFSSIVRNEVLAMAKALPELEQALIAAGDDESTHKQSFVSLGTTLDGIRAVVSLALTTVSGEEYTTVEEVNGEDTLLDSIPALDILSFLNIVGVPIQAMVAEGGDYPDPFRYGVKAVFPGHYCSLSDIILHHQNAQKQMGEEYTYGAAKGIELPGFKADGLIDSVIPLFDSPLIFQFLYKNAPQSLNYYSSVGMRRMIADIPGTLPATLTAALVKLLRVVSVEPTEVNITTMLNVYESLKACSTLTFNLPIYRELLDMIVFDMVENTKVEETSRLLPVIETNFTQLLFPLMELYQTVFIHNAPSIGKKLLSLLEERYGEEYGAKYADNFTDMAKVKKHFNIIFRSIYTNEVWCTLRTTYRNKPDSASIVNNTGFDIIGYDHNFPLKIEKSDISFDSITAQPISPDFDMNDVTGKTIRPLDDREGVAYVNSNTFKTQQGRVNHLNVMLLIPHVSQLAVLAKDDSKKAEYAALVKNTPMLFPAAESIFQQMKANALPEAQRIENAKKHSKTISTSINALYRDIFYTANSEKELPAVTFDTVRLVKLLNMCYAYTFTTLEDRYPTLVVSGTTITRKSTVLLDWNSLLQIDPKPDTIASIAKTHPFLADMEARFLTQSQNRYRTVVKEFITTIEDDIAAMYSAELLAATSVEQYCTLLGEGIVRYNKPFVFKDPHSAYFHTFFKKLTTLQPEGEETDGKIPFQCDKVLVTINGRTAAGDAVWNNGDLLFIDKLHKISLLFYKDEDDKSAARGKWIEFSKQYLVRKRDEKWKYRDSDLPNRHSHHLTRPSYWGLGYASMEEFKAGVTTKDFKAYCEEHATCCGLGQGERIRHWIDIGDDCKPYHKQP